MKSLKFVPMLLVTLAATATPAFAWDNLISCDGGNLVVEKECHGGPSEYGNPACYTSEAQMIIRNAEIQNYFAGKHAFGSYQNPGRFSGFNSDTREMLVKIDNFKDWGMSGRYYYSLAIPYADDGVEIGYFINYVGPRDVKVTAVSKRSSVYNIVPDGVIADWTFHNCDIRR